MVLNFTDTTPELFAGQELGEDAVRVLLEAIGEKVGFLEAR